MQLSIEHKASNINQTFEIDDKFFGVAPEDLLVHIGLNTYTLKTTKTEKECDIEKRLAVFADQEFDSMSTLFPDFGSPQSDVDIYRKLIEAIQHELKRRLNTSDVTKLMYEEYDEKDKLLRMVLESFAKHVAARKGVENFAKEAKKRITHPCFPIDYSNRLMTYMRHILNDDYTDIDIINKEYTDIFQDIEMDNRAKVGLIGILSVLEKFTHYLGDISNAGKKVELYEVSRGLKRHAENSFEAIKQFKNDCLSDSRVDVRLHDDKFSDYIIKYNNAVDLCINTLTDLDKKQVTAAMDQLELRHYIDTAIGNLYSTCDKLLLQYTLDTRDISQAEDAYIIGFYSAVYATAEKDDSTTPDNRYAIMFRNIVNISLQQNSLLKNMNFPTDISIIKKYVEDEYTNILHK